MKIGKPNSKPPIWLVVSIPVVTTVVYSVAMIGITENAWNGVSSDAVSEVMAAATAAFGTLFALGGAFGLWTLDLPPIAIPLIISDL